MATQIEINKAVFLSYASEDATAALRICTALREAVIEVWFDQSELRGGEGYFRLEWKLAVDRSHLMAANLPFLLPVATRCSHRCVPTRAMRIC